MRYRPLILFGLVLCGLAILLTSGLIYQAMDCYPGGTILQRNSEGYDFWHNYLSDLGRQRAWNRTLNQCSNIYFNYALTAAAGSIMLFFALMGLILNRSQIEKWGLFLLSVGSAMAYLGILWFPLDVNYRLHTIYVRVGFISFCILSFVFAFIIQREQKYPNRYAVIMYLFVVAFAVQISIMLLGPRAWTSQYALFLQVTAQKIIVALQLVVMLIQSFGAIHFLRLRND